MILDVHQIVQTGSDWVSAVRVMPPTPGSGRPARVAAASYDGTVYADDAPLCAVGSAVLCLAPFRLHIPDPTSLGLPHAHAHTRPASPLCAGESTSSAMSNGTSTTAGSDEAAAAASAAATTLSFVATGDSAGMLSVYLVGAEGGGGGGASRLVARHDCGKLSSLCCVSPSAGADGDVDLVAAGGRCVHLIRFSASRRRQATARHSSKPQEAPEATAAAAAAPAPQHPCTPLVHCASFGGFAAPVVRPPATKRQRVDDGPAAGSGGGGGGGCAVAAAAEACDFALEKHLTVAREFSAAVNKVVCGGGAQQGRLVYAGGDDAVVKGFELDRGAGGRTAVRRRCAYRGLTASVTAIACCPGMVAAGAYDSSVRIWSICTGSALYAVRASAFASLAPAPDAAAAPAAPDSVTALHLSVQEADGSAAEAAAAAAAAAPVADGVPPPRVSLAGAAHNGVLFSASLSLAAVPLHGRRHSSGSGGGGGASSAGGGGGGGGGSYATDGAELFSLPDTSEVLDALFLRRGASGRSLTVYAARGNGSVACAALSPARPHAAASSADGDNDNDNDNDSEMAVAAAAAAAAAAARRRAAAAAAVAETSFAETPASRASPADQQAVAHAAAAAAVSEGHRCPTCGTNPMADRAAALSKLDSLQAEKAGVVEENKRLLSVIRDLMRENDRLRCGVTAVAAAADRQAGAGGACGGSNLQQDNSGCGDDVFDNDDDDLPSTPLSRASVDDELPLY